MIFLVGLGAAVLLGGGYVLQQHQAAQVPAVRLRPGLLLVLLHRPMWLAGIAAMVGGQVMGAAALGLAPLVVVEPLLATNMLFALPLAALWSRRRLRRPEWLGAACVVAGLALFLVLDRPQQTDLVLIGPKQLLVIGPCTAALVVALMTAAPRRRPRVRALLLAAAAGVVFGVQDLLTQQVVGRLGNGFLTGLESWPVPAVVVTAIVGLTLSQNAFSAADLSASLPALTLAEPISGFLLSVLLLGQAVRTAPWLLLAGTGGLALMIVGLILLTRSPLLADPHNRRR